MLLHHCLLNSMWLYRQTDVDELTMFTKAIVHIGLQKTGSTTLQAQAHANQRHLSKQLGIHYPSRSSLSTRGNHSYSLAAMFPTSDSVTAEGERFRRDYEDQFAQCADPVVMLSAEGVAGFGAERLSSFRSWLSSVASEVVFVAVVRGPYDRALSGILQHVKQGGTFDNCSQYLYSRSARSQLEILRKTLPSDQLVLLDFASVFSSDWPLGVLIRAALPSASMDAFNPVTLHKTTLNSSLSNQSAYLWNAVNTERRYVLNGGPRNGDIGPLRFRYDLSHLESHTGKAFNPPGCLVETIMSHVENELQYLEETFSLVLEPSSRPPMFEHDLDPAAPLLRRRARSLSDTTNMKKLRRLKQLVAGRCAASSVLGVVSRRHRNHTPSHLPAAIEMARILGRGTTSRLQREPAIVETVLEEIARSSVAIQYQNAVDLHEG